MEEWKVIMQNRKAREETVYASGETVEKFLEFMQYAIDNMSDPEKLLLLNPRNGVTYDAYAIATEHYGMRKRTFSERMDNVKTYSI